MAASPFASVMTSNVGSVEWKNVFGNLPGLLSLKPVVNVPKPPKFSCTPMLTPDVSGPMTFMGLIAPSWGERNISSPTEARFPVTTGASFILSSFPFSTDMPPPLPPALLPVMVPPERVIPQAS